MESNESTDNEQMEPEGRKTCWVAFTCGIGKYIALALGDREEIDAAHERGGVIKCLEAYEFGCPIQMNQTPKGVAVGKIHYSTRLDSTMYNCPAQFSLTGASLYYLDDLNKQGGDFDQYKEFIKNAQLAAEQAATARSAKRSGIVTAPASALSHLGGSSGRGRSPF